MAGWDIPAAFVIERTVAADAIDGLEHTNNAVYVQWCEQAAWRHSEALGIGLDDYRALDRAMAVIRGEYDYLAAARLGDRVAIATWITGWDRRLTMTRAFQVRREEDGVTLLRGRVTFACIEISSGKPRRMPPVFLAVYGPAIVGAEG
ncbi:MAG TPA: thioesterase family protein [Pseudohaliea sp.]|nr:thioesterase family protein [Pseudohaliea sp.]